MQFRKQVVLGIGVQVAIVFLMAVVAVTTLIGRTRTSAEEARRSLREVAAIDRVEILVEELVARARGYLLTGSQAYLDLSTDSRAQLDVALGALRILEPLDPRVAAVASEALVYEQAIETAVREREQVRDLSSLERLYEQRLAPQRQRLRDALAALQDHHRAHLAEVGEREQRITHLVSIGVAVGAVLAISLSIALGIRMGRRLSERYRSEQRATAEVAEAARARKELLDIVSHDLRSPLSTVLLGLDAMREEGKLTHLAAVQNATRRMQRLVDDLLVAARAEAYGLDLVLKEVDSQELMRLAAEMFAVKAERAGVELRVEQGPHAMVTVDQDRVLQILANLVGNALKVTPFGGAIVLAAEPTEGGIRLSVRDSGPGIAKEAVSEVFEAYRQLGDRARRGSLGLGLYISTTLTKAHGGRIGVETAPDHGSTFWVELPDPRTVTGAPAV